jgi:serine protease Do
MNLHFGHCQRDTGSRPVPGRVAGQPRRGAWPGSRTFCRTLFGLGLAAAFGLSAGQAQTARTNVPAAAFPKSAAANRAKLPTPFTKPLPASVADLRVMEREVKGLVARLSPAVVAVEVGTGTGSAVIISPDGLMLTAGHVSGKPDRDVRVRFADGRTARARTLGNHTSNDTGLMQITDPGPWPFVPVGEVEQVRLGDWVLALGHPGGFDAQRARVARLGRVIQLAPGVLQTDCTISPGDSGGALFDMYGRVIGIHSFISSSMTENYHVPINRFREDWKQLLKPAAPVSTAYLGAKFVAAESGCRLTSVEPRTPASRAGLKAGDYVVKVEDRQILTAATFQRWLSDARPGDTLALEIKRGQQTLQISVKLEAPPKPR